MKKGFTLMEMLIVILLGMLIIGAIVGLYAAHQKVQAPIKMTSDIIEIQRTGMAQLEWVFSRWGTGTPCYNYNATNSTSPVVCTRIVDCRVNGTFVYPPPSSLCVTIRDGSPCDELWFYANLEGVGVVSNVYRDTAQLVSCRLKTTDNNNCYYIIRYGKFFVDDSNKTNILVFRLNGLNENEQNLECLDAEYLNPYKYNAEISINATIYNGIINGENWLQLQGGDILVRVPKRVHLYCENGRDGRLWLKMDLEDMAENCRANEPSIDISPVERFDAEIIPTPLANIASIRVQITFRNFENPGSPNYRTYIVERYFGR